MPDMIEINPFLSFNIAVMLLLGKAITLRSEILRKYSIPEPVIGGVLCAGIIALLDPLFGWQVYFHLEMRDFFLLVFFAGIGLGSDISTLREGGRPLVILLLLATGYMVAQNFLGMSVAAAFGLEPRAGLMAGSISLTGGVGTTAAWAPIFEERLGIENAMELGIASNMVGLIAAYLMRRHKVEPSQEADLYIGLPHDTGIRRIDYFGILWAILILNTAVMLGIGVHALIEQTGLTMPRFVGCLIAGILLRNLGWPLFKKRGPRNRRTIALGLSLMSDLALGLFLTMALMGLQLWRLEGIVTFIMVVLALQILMTVLFTVFVLFRAMGGDYEATVVAAGFGGITLGSTATAVANMTAVTQQYGAAHRAFIIVPIVCGFFIDLINALVIAVFVG